MVKIISEEQIQFWPNHKKGLYDFCYIFPRSSEAIQFICEHIFVNVNCEEKDFCIFLKNHLIHFRELI